MSRYHNRLIRLNAVVYRGHIWRVWVKVPRKHRYIIYNTWDLEPKWIKQYVKEYNMRYDYHDTYSQSEVAQVQNSYATDGTSGLLLNPFDLSYADVREADEIPF